MTIRYGLLCASMLAGLAMTGGTASAEPARPAVAHPHWSHPAHPFRPGIRPAYRPGHPGFRPGYRYGRPYFHRFGFRGPIVRLSVSDRAIWTRGHWRHAWFHGRFGWWFVAGGGWYFYPQPVYPYPDSISDTYYADESGDYADDQGGYDNGSSGQNWYYCRNPQGYYPYVKSCAGGWQTVPATPQDQSGSDDDSYGPPDQDGGYDNGPPPDSGDYDNGPPPDNSGDYDDDDGYGPPR